MSGPKRLLRGFLRVPLFSKLLVGNGVLVLGAGIAGATLPVAGAGGGALPLYLGAVLVASLGFNAVIVSLALRPLKLLEATARRVQEGELGARVPRSAVADRELSRLTDVFNGMLDSVEALRARHRRLTLHALEGEERERRRLAAVLYDRIAQGLAALLLQAETAAREDPAAVHPSALREMAGSVLEEVRALARELRAPELDDLGLLPAVRAHARHLAARSRRPVQVLGVEGPLPRETRVALYRIVQASLALLGEGDDRRVAIEVPRNGCPVRLAVSARRGADRPEAGTLEDSPALFTLRERAAFLGGTLRVSDGEGGRRTIEITVPRPPRGEPTPAADGLP